MSAGQYQGSNKGALRKVEAALQTLLHQPEGEKVKIPTSVPFTDEEDNAHSWNNTIVLKYFALKLELPTAYDAIKDGEVTGLDLLSMNEKYPHPALPATMHPMHKLKIYTHVDKLRAKVISRAKKTRPEDFLDWDASHVASWLFIEQGDELATLIALRGNWTGKSLEEIVKHHGGARGWSQLSSEQQKSLLTAITLLLERNQYTSFNKINDATKSASSVKRKSKKKKTTALKRRHMNKLNNNLFDDSDYLENDKTEESHELHRGEVDLPPPAYEIVAQSEAPYVFDRNIANNNIIKPPSLPLSAPSASAPPSTKKRDPSSRSKRHSNLQPVDEIDFISDNNDSSDINDNDLSESELLVIKTNHPQSQQQDQQERSQFLKKIADLQAIVSHHAKEINRLQKQTFLLQKEKDKVTLEKMHLQENSKQFQETLSRLQIDRDIATQELTKVVSLFATHASTQEANMKQQIQTLQQQVANTQKDNQKQRSTQVKASETISPELQLLLNKVKEVKEYPSLNIMPATTAIISHEAQIDKSSNNNDINNNNNIDNIVIKNTISTNNSVGNNSDSDLDDTAVSSPKQQTPTVKPTQQESSAMSQMLDSLANGSLQELQHWRFCTQRLKLPRDRFVSLSLAGDTRQLLLVVATRWVSLGRHLLRHNLQPLLFPGQKYNTNNNNNSMDNNKKMIESIEYMRMCSKALLNPLHRHYHWHVPSRSQTTPMDSTNNSTNKITLAEDAMRVTLTLGNTKSNDHNNTNISNNKTSYLSRYGQLQQSLRSCASFPDENAQAVALVFVLATLTRHLQRFQHISHTNNITTNSTTNTNSSDFGYTGNNSNNRNISHDLADVSVFIQALQQGQLPQIVISRDNLRDFIAHQLGMELTWEDFDALAQRIDKDKSGFIAFPELFSAFSSLHPMVHTLSLINSNNSLPQKPLSTSKPTMSSEILTLTPLVVQLFFTLFSDHVLTMSMVKVINEDTESNTNNIDYNKEKAITLGETWLRFFTQPTHYRTSATKFKRFLQRLEILREKMNSEAKSQAEILLSFSEREKQAYLKKMKSKQQYHQDLLQDQGLMSALLLEGTKNGVDFLQKVVHIIPDLKKRHFQRTRSATVSSSLPTVYSTGTLLFSCKNTNNNNALGSAVNSTINSSLNTENTHNVQAIASLTEQLMSLISTHFPSKHEEFTLHIAHGCNIFAQTENEDNSEQDVLGGLAYCLATFWQLRYHALHYLEYPQLHTTNSNDNNNDTNTDKLNTTKNTAQNTPSLLSVMEQQLLHLYHSNPQLSLNLTPPIVKSTDGDTDGDTDHITNSKKSNCTWDITRLLQTEEHFSRLFGFPVTGTCFETVSDVVPHHVYGSMCAWPRFHRNQVYIEALLSDIRTSLYWDKDLLDLSNDMPCSSTNNTTNKLSKSGQSSPHKSSAKRSAKSAAILADLQRTLHAELWGTSDKDNANNNNKNINIDYDTSTMPLQVISEVNEKFAEQRIEQMTKYLDVLNHRATRKKHILASLLSLWQSTKLALKENHVFLSDKERALALPIAEIVQQTRSIQNVLLRDMQKIEPTKITLLEDRITLLRKNIDEGNIVDEQGVLKALCHEVDAIRASLLQANNDAMRLSARILQHVEPLLPANK